MNDEETNNDALSQPDQEETTKPDPSDQLTPDHPRFKQVLAKLHDAEEKLGKFADLEAKYNDLVEKIDRRQTQDGDTTYTDEEMASLERIDKALKGRGYVTQDVLDRERNVIQRDIQFSKLEDQYNGTNGLPKFDRVDVGVYAKEHGFGNNYEAAFKQMHWDTFVQQEAKKMNTVTPPGSEKPGGGDKGKPDTDLLSKVGEMSDEEYEKNREAIMGAVRPKS